MGSLKELQDINTIIQSEQQGFNRFSYEQSLKDLWNNTKKSNICVIGVAEEEQKESYKFASTPKGKGSQCYFRYFS